MDSVQAGRDNAGMAAPPPPLPAADDAPDQGRTVLLAAAVFWTAHYLLLAFRALFFDRFAIGDGEMALRRVPIHLLGLALSLGLYGVLRASGGRPFGWRAAALALLVMPAAAVYGFGSDMLLWYVRPSIRPEPYFPIMVWQSMFPWIGSFAAWAAVLLVLDHAATLRDRERRLAAVQLLAREAEMQALRHQLNPHFLFNTLNSISSLIWEGEPERAEAMVIALADFLRATLEIDAAADVTLAEEVALQQHYLAIERIRFPARLDVRFAIPPALARARVPGLILQPVVENAIKYAVAPSNAQIHVRIAALGGDGRLELVVEDDGEAVAAPATAGTGLGLAIVRRRLVARFGETATLSAVRGGKRGFRVTLAMPLDLT